MSQLRLTTAAVADISEAQAWYDEAGPSLGRRLLLELESKLSLVAENPEVGAVVVGTTRRVLLRAFPYAVYYELRDDAVIVVGVLHHRRSPTTLAGRVEGTG